jgi:hypothetical protein
LLGKDWAGELLMRMWRDLRLDYVAVDWATVETLDEAECSIPREDLVIYLTAKAGAIQCLVSANHEPVAALAAATGAFECLKPDEFVSRYLNL